MRWKLDKNWKITYDNGNSVPAKVPGDITADLYRAGVIKEPYYGINHRELGWIIETDFVYQKTFDIDEKFFEKDEIFLVFEGIDTFAEIELNGNHLGTTQNMFLEYELSVKDYVKREGNLLKVFWNFQYRALFCEKNAMSLWMGLGTKLAGIWDI